MPVAFDAATESIRTTTTDPWTFDHTPVGTPRGVLVTAVNASSSVDRIVGITYGGQALTRVRTAADTAGEPGRTDIWFLGTGIPAGQRTVSVDLDSATTDDFQFVCITLTADADTEKITDGILEGDRANPSITLSYGGRTCIAIAADYTGTASPGTPGADTTLIDDYDHGANGATVVRQTTVGSADFTISVTHVSDDCAFVAAAISQKVDNRAEVSFVEFEVPFPDNRAEVSFVEFEVPIPDNRAEVSFVEFEVPSLDNRAEVSFVEFEVPSLDNRAEVSFVELEVPDTTAVRRAYTVKYYTLKFRRGVP